MKIVTTEQMKALERQSDEAGVSYLKLMENAGQKLAEYITELTSSRDTDILFLCGTGNNAGDCFVAAGILSQRKIKVKIALVCGKPKTELSQQTLARLSDVVPVTDDSEEIHEAVRKASCIVDGVFGTGFHGELSENIAVILGINKTALKIAVDVPSGGNAATGGASEGCFNADYTVTFGYKKFGMTQYPLKKYCGEILVADIGIPDECVISGVQINELDDFSIAEKLRERIPDSHKGTYGTLLCVTGSAGMPGASLLSGEVALRCGCGLAKMCSVPENIASAASRLPEAVYVRMKADENGFYKYENIDKILELSQHSDAVLIGCGLGVTDETTKLVTELIRKINCPIILDADGINCICSCINILREANNGIILTPHPAEMSRLTGLTVSQIQSDRLKACTEFTSQYENTVLVLKGAGTVIAAPNKICVNNTGNAGMSCGGSGDVLSGMIASFVSQGIEQFTSAVLGVNIHGKAGDIAAKKYSMHYMLPSDMIRELPGIFQGTELMQ